MKSYVKIKLFDFVVIGFTLVITLGAGFLIYLPGNSQGEFVIEAPERKWIYPMDADTVVQVQGEIGITLVEIHDGSARIISSPCANQTCVAAGYIRRANQWVACLPNKIFLHIEGKDHNDEDYIDGATW